MKIEEIGLVLTVIIFLLSIALNNYQMYYDRKKSWYMSIIINSNLEKIDSFFKEIFKEFKESRKYLVNTYSEPTPEYIIDKAKKEKKLHRLKDNFHFEMLPVFKSYNIKLSSKLEDALMMFQDTYTDNIGIENKEDTTKIINELIESKRNFYDVLYSPIKSSFFQRMSPENLLLIALLILFIFLFTYNNI